MSWMMRIGLFVGGLVLLGAGKLQLQSGHWVFDNANYHQTTFAAGAVGIGIFLCALAFLPSGDWVYRHITTRHTFRLPKKQRDADSLRE
jgi:hypothetical protein